jgi:hypothetical protein
MARSERTFHSRRRRFVAGEREGRDRKDEKKMLAFVTWM